MNQLAFIAFSILNFYTENMEKTLSDRYDSLRTYSLVIMTVVLVIFVLKTASSVFLPIVIAFFLFVFINPFLNKCDKFRIPKFISMLIAMIFVLLVFILFLYTFFAMVDTLMRKLPQYVVRVNALDQMISSGIKNIFDIEDSQFFSILSWLNIDWFGLLSSFLAQASSKFVDILGDCVLIYLYLLFIVLERATIYPKIVVALPSEKGRKLADMTGRVNKLTSKYLFLKLMVSAATGVLFYVTAVLSNLDFPLVWGILAFLLNFIPTIGSIIVTVGAILMALVQFAPDWNRVVVIGLALVAIQMILGNIIDPKIQGVQLNISPLVILISLALWGYIWGLIGMFLAVPLTSCVQIICASIPSLKPIAIFLSTGSAYMEKKEKKSFFRKKEKSNKDN